MLMGYIAVEREVFDRNVISCQVWLADEHYFNRPAITLVDKAYAGLVRNTIMKYLNGRPATVRNVSKDVMDYFSRVLIGVSARRIQLVVGEDVTELDLLKMFAPEEALLYNVRDDRVALLVKDIESRYDEIVFGVVKREGVEKPLVIQRWDRSIIYTAVTVDLDTMYDAILLSPLPLPKYCERGENLVFKKVGEEDEFIIYLARVKP